MLVSGVKQDIRFWMARIIAIFLLLTTVVLMYIFDYPIQQSKEIEYSKG